jgi:hypothetical protein
VDFGVCIGDVVGISIGVKEEIRRVENPDATTPSRDGRGDVQSVDKHGALVESPVAVGVLVDTDPVAAPKRRTFSMGRGGREAVIDRPPDSVPAHRLEPGRFGVLAVFDDPEAPAFVEAQLERLKDGRFGKHEFHLEVVRGR